MPTTRSPLSMSASTRVEPMKPAAPVTTAVIRLPFLAHLMRCRCYRAAELRGARSGGTVCGKARPEQRSLPPKGRWVPLDLDADTLTAATTVAARSSAVIEGFSGTARDGLAFRDMAGRTAVGDGPVSALTQRTLRAYRAVLLRDGAAAPTPLCRRPGGRRELPPLSQPSGCLSSGAAASFPARLDALPVVSPGPHSVWLSASHGGPRADSRC